MSDLQGIHSKARLDFTNIETLFTTVELAKTIGKLPGKGPDEEIEQVSNALRGLIIGTLEYSIKFNDDGERRRAPGNYGEFAQLVMALRHRSVDVAVITFNYDVACDVAFLWHGDGRHTEVRAFVERAEVTGKDGGPIQVEDLSKIEIAKRIAYALRRGARSDT